MLGGFGLISTGLFFLTYIFFDFYTASLALSISSFLYLCFLHFSVHKPSSFEVANLLFLVLFAFLTWYFQNERFVQWKLSILYFVLGMGIAAYGYYSSDPFFKAMLASHKMSIASPLAQKVDHAISLFFLILAFSNLFVMYNYSLSTWVYFKLSLVVVNLLFFVGLIVKITPSIKLEAEHEISAQPPKKTSTSDYDHEQA